MDAECDMNCLEAFSHLNSNSHFNSYLDIDQSIGRSFAKCQLRQEHGSHRRYAQRVPLYKIMINFCCYLDDPTSLSLRDGTRGAMLLCLFQIGLGQIAAPPPSIT
ncbi:hypothetical protein SeMB42_g02511 [Synchytrium endobioticum]|uniref:Uncharacterized protein n=1 Tax=Synchytrium endobioticum TaxID=286115 RepID=A0A507DER6_9FUNG|nr:hypothetical protein SeMB42_g02511 [Synchytrium endobioticum]